ncbi:hypothetical protein SI65_00014 [Aspergillus cristatus]|uniref:SigF-like NTF2-like domain-containing protein n=1 Tax=Aspergillus cristatus TaxID=573508 RepID=A0A1E3BPW4_ASPCR|nr:hypothetical protein SI65_00014 [Aspergillus cristatus]
MENPVEDVPAVIQMLIESPPSLQQKAIERFFTPSAEFVHPFCRVWGYKGSRWAIVKIFQWYKIMSPRIEHQIHSIAFDKDNLKLYVNMSQLFSIWLIPFHVAPVTLTTVLTLMTSPGEEKHTTNGTRTHYFIAKQEDLYQTSEFIKFVVPHVGHLVIYAWQAFATLFCLFGVALFWPLIWLEERGWVPGRVLRGGNLVYDIDKKIPDIKET